MWQNTLSKFGMNSNVGMPEEDIWDGGGIYGFYPSFAQSMEILSNNANDSLAGTGLRTVQIYGLDNNWNFQNEIKSLNGLTPVSLSADYIRIFRMIGRTAGSGNKNAGDIICRIQGTGTIAAIIRPGNNQTLMALWPVPAGRTLYLAQWWGASLDEKGAEVSLFVRPFNEIFQLKRRIILKDNSFILPIPYQLKMFSIAEKSDITVRALCEKEDSIVTSGFDGWHE